MVALSLALCTPALVSARDSSNPQNSTGSQTMASSQDHYSQNQTSTVAPDQMVTARAGLVNTLDAKDASPGQTFEAKLPSKVHLKNGTELPGGTMLIGNVAQDDMNVQGKSKLALCINEARLKDGKIIPVKATVVGIYGPGTQTSEYNMSSAAGDQAPNPWHAGVTKIDELDALHNVDLHSDLNSRNSGVLVSKKDNDIKLKPGTELALAIAETGNNQQGSNNPGGH
jgi:hypothetical protein